MSIKKMIKNTLGLIGWVTIGAVGWCSFVTPDRPGETSASAVSKPEDREFPYHPSDGGGLDRRPKPRPEQAAPASSTASEDAGRKARECRANEFSAKSLARMALRAAPLRDPGSVEIISATLVSDNGIAGQFRAKNGFGGYAVSNYIVAYTCVRGSNSPSRATVVHIGE